MANTHLKNVKSKTVIKQMAFFCIIAIIINMVGVGISALLDFPLYLDTLGTMLAAVSGGYLPGIIVGFATNMIKGCINTQDMYYNIINILTAVCTAYFAKKGFFKSSFKPFVTVPVLTVITGISGSLLTWFLNNSDIGGIGEKYALYFYEKAGIQKFTSQLLADFLVEFIDKSITVLAAVIILKVIPEKFYTKLKRQSALSPDIEADMRKTKCRSVSLRTKILLILVAAALMIAGTSTAISFMLFKSSTIDEHIKLANGLTELAAGSIDAEMTDEYIKNGQQAQGYAETEQMLYKLKNSSPDVEFIYVYKITEEGCRVVFDLDTDELEGSAAGDLIEFDDSFMPLVPSLLAGEEIEPIISDDSYGWLLTVYKPVYDKNGICRCYAAVDVSMNLLSTYGYSFMSKLLSLFIGFFILILTAVMWFVENNIILPVNTMAYCAGAFAYNSDEARAESVERIKELNISTGDEIENLYLAFLKTTSDSMQYVDDIQHKTETISKMQNGLIMVLADMVESRDKCTGDHVRKTAAYVKIIMDEMKKRGMYKEQLTDEFIQNVINAAPLHDIGKIHISDVILNKPDKLTDEEFAIMKSHTTLGSEIIERAIDMVPDSDYLNEAKNLSEYHHEKWNGKGYPHGISGEDIPLSARIMAVADVFDALVSRRSYKTPFSFEKAMSIIREDAGTHFDPLVAEAFLGAENRVRKVAEEFEQMNENNA